MVDINSSWFEHSATSLTLAVHSVIGAIHFHMVVKHNQTLTGVSRKLEESCEFLLFERRIVDSFRGLVVGTRIFADWTATVPFEPCYSSSRIPR